MCNRIHRSYREAGTAQSPDSGFRASDKLFSALQVLNSKIQA